MTDTAKPKSNNSELDIFRRAVEDRANADNSRGRGQEDEKAQVRGTVLYSDKGAIDVRCNQHMGLITKLDPTRLPDLQPISLVAVPIQGLAGFFGEDGVTFTVPANLPAIDLPPNNYSAVTVAAIYAVFSLVSKETMEREVDDDPFFDLATLAKVYEPHCDLNVLVQYYDEITTSIMRVGGYYMTRDHDSTKITLGWKARNKIKDEYLTRQQSIITQMEADDKQLHTSLAAFNETN